MNIYLDTCCFNRPYDEPLSDRIILESEAVLSIIDRCETLGVWHFFSSDILDDEMGRIVDAVKRQQVFPLYRLAFRHIELNPTIIVRAQRLRQFHLAAFDAFHLACAEYANADVLLTTDKKFIKRAKLSPAQIRVENPLVWLMEMTHEY